jgi:hypothetical protein
MVIIAVGAVSEFSVPLLSECKAQLDERMSASSYQFEDRC